MKEMGGYQEVLGCSDVNFDWGLFGARRAMCCVGGCKGMGDKRVLTPCGTLSEWGYAGYLIQALAGDELPLRPLVEALRASAEPSTPGFPLRRGRGLVPSPGESPSSPATPLAGDVDRLSPMTPASGLRAAAAEPLPAWMTLRPGAFKHAVVSALVDKGMSEGYELGPISGPSIYCKTDRTCGRNCMNGHHHDSNNFRCFTYPPPPPPPPQNKNDKVDSLVILEG